MTVAGCSGCAECGSHQLHEQAWPSLHYNINLLIDRMVVHMAAPESALLLLRQQRT
jgi:hypothetical protein